LRQIGIAAHGYHDAIGNLPAGWSYRVANRHASGSSAFGWTVSLLPFLDQNGLSTVIDPTKDLSDPYHAVALNTSLQSMLCPSDIVYPSFELLEELSEGADGEDSPSDTLLELPTANYVAVFGTIEPDDQIPAPIGDGVFLEIRTTRFNQFGRGLSVTFLIGERTMSKVPSTWLGVDLRGEDAAARLVGAALEGINNPLADECDFSSRHPRGANFLWGDGHVSLVSESLDLGTYHRFAKLGER
jgi:prepilin-type processing-associated H-X9-DG protein